MKIKIVEGKLFVTSQKANWRSGPTPSVAYEDMIDYRSYTRNLSSREIKA